MAPLVLHRTEDEPGLGLSAEVLALELFAPVDGLRMLQLELGPWWAQVGKHPTWIQLSVMWRKLLRCAPPSVRKHLVHEHHWLGNLWFVMWALLLESRNVGWVRCEPRCQGSLGSVLLTTAKHWN
mmetsp:Transcript_82775/g.181926  ORF Transcript_82775/g.181926 Transcript_82775/m.181926 type:complete len:125 (+) Transcript_82775:1494-1868(+)